MISRSLTLFATLAVALPCVAEVALYPTGPSEDAAFLRFINATDADASVKAASGARLELPVSAAASDFMTVPAGKSVTGVLQQEGAERVVELSVAPGEFASVVAVQTPTGLHLHTLREQPDDFNALKASLAYTNLDPSCAKAELKVAGRDVAIFSAVAEQTVQRRPINPVQLSVQLHCAGLPIGAPLALGQLEAGQRYTVLSVPAIPATRLLAATDNLAD